MWICSGECSEEKSYFWSLETQSLGLSEVSWHFSCTVAVQLTHECTKLPICCFITLSSTVSFHNTVAAVTVYKVPLDILLRFA